jgi:hypothetical protein
MPKARTLSSDTSELPREAPTPRQKILEADLEWTITNQIRCARLAIELDPCPPGETIEGAWLGLADWVMEELLIQEEINAIINR